MAENIWVTINILKMWVLLLNFYNLTRTYKPKLTCFNAVTVRADRFINIIII